MNAKNLLAIALLLFVAASIVVLAVKSLREDPQAAQAGSQAAQAAQSPAADGVIAYYFHGKVRCPTCRSIEAYAHEAVNTGFTEQLGSGQIQWQVVNYEEPGNEHFATDYELIAPSVVLVRNTAGSPAKSKNLDRVWELVGDKVSFVEYVQQETRDFLAASGGNSG